MPGFFDNLNFDTPSMQLATGLLNSGPGTYGSFGQGLGQAMLMATQLQQQQAQREAYQEQLRLQNERLVQEIEQRRKEEERRKQAQRILAPVLGPQGPSTAGALPQTPGTPPGAPTAGGFPQAPGSPYGAPTGMSALGPSANSGTLGPDPLIATYARAALAAGDVGTALSLLKPNRGTIAGPLQEYWGMRQMGVGHQEALNRSMPLPSQPQNKTTGGFAMDPKTGQTYSYYWDQTQREYMVNDPEEQGQPIPFSGFGKTLVPVGKSTSQTSGEQFGFPGTKSQQFETAKDVYQTLTTNELGQEAIDILKNDPTTAGALGDWLQKVGGKVGQAADFFRSEKGKALARKIKPEGRVRLRTIGPILASRMKGFVLEEKGRISDDDRRIIQTAIGVLEGDYDAADIIEAISTAIRLYNKYQTVQKSFVENVAAPGVNLPIPAGTEEYFQE